MIGALNITTPGKASLSVIRGVSPRVLVDVERRTVGFRATFPTLQGPPGQAGAPGPRGQAGPAGSAGSYYRHVQSQASLSWMVPHNLGLIPTVQITDSNGEVIVCEIKHLDFNTCQISFNNPMLGSAQLN